MAKKINYTLTPSELDGIKQAQRNSPSPQVRQRATAIHLLHLGNKPQQVAEVLNVTRSTIYNWVQRWQQSGLPGLSDKPKNGRPQLATPQYIQKLEQLIDSDPTEWGYSFTSWTINRLMAHLERETGITMSDETFRQLLKKHNYVYRRPKHDLTPLQDPEARERAEDLLDTLKKRPIKENSNFSLWMRAP